MGDAICNSIFSIVKIKSSLFSEVFWEFCPPAKND